MILTAPFSSYTHQSPYHFYSGFNKYFYASALGDKYDICCEPSGNWFEFVALEVNILRGVVEKYTSTKMSLWDRLLKALFTMRLKHYSRISVNADELRCLRYCVTARKK